MPAPKKGTSIVKFRCGYSNQNNVLIIAEIYKDYYTIGLWDFKIDSIGLIMKNEEETSGNLKCIEIFENSSTLFFAMIETKSIKYWKFQYNRMILVNKIHVKDDIVDAKISTLTNFLLFVTDSGRLFIVNDEVLFNCNY